MDQLLRWRAEFPIVDTCTYLVSHSLGAMPKRTSAYLQQFADVDEAIARANDSNYGLAAAVWTKDIKKAHYVARKLQAGTVWINTYNIYDTAAPFGGYKQSGFGREMSVHALDYYTQVKTVWVDLT